MRTPYNLIGFACDEGVKRNNGRPGADKGPAAFREALKKINWHPANTNFYTDLGDISCADGDLETAQKKLAARVFQALSNKQTPFVIGGGHETAWGHFQGLSQFFGQADIGIINFDAHFDLRPLLDDRLGTSGTPFLQIAQERQSKNLSFDYLVLGLQRFSNSESLFQTAKNLGVQFVMAQDLEKQANTQINTMLQKHEHIYLSICLDVFAEAFAPGVSAPQALGLLPAQVISLLEQIMKSGKVVALDIAELAPAYDRQNTTAKLAASLFAMLIHEKSSSSTNPEPFWV